MKTGDSQNEKGRGTSSAGLGRAAVAFEAVLRSVFERSPGVLIRDIPLTDPRPVVALLQVDMHVGFMRCVGAGPKQQHSVLGVIGR
jgi:hypothetical protein